VDCGADVDPLSAFLLGIAAGGLRNIPRELASELAGVSTNPGDIRRWRRVADGDYVAGARVSRVHKSGPGDRIEPLGRDPGFLAELAGATGSDGFHSTTGTS
jgi:hypothetical protein